MKNLRDRIVDIATVLGALGALLMSAVVVTESRQRAFARDGGAPRELRNWRDHVVGGRWIGSPTVPVTIVEFGDYECPACRTAQRHLESVMARHGSKVALLYRHWPLPYHSRAYPAARAAECAAAQGKFEPVHTLLYSTSNWMSAPRDGLVEIATRAGLHDLPAFELCLSNAVPVPEIERDIIAAAAIGRGTPTIIINNQLIRSFPDSVLMNRLVLNALDARR